MMTMIKTNKPWDKALIHGLIFCFGLVTTGCYSHFASIPPSELPKLNASKTTISSWNATTYSNLYNTTITTKTDSPVIELTTIDNEVKAMSGTGYYVDVVNKNGTTKEFHDPFSIYDPEKKVLILEEAFGSPTTFDLGDVDHVEIRLPDGTKTFLAVFIPVSLFLALSLGYIAIAGAPGT